jgi:hypothetical protein
MAALTDEMLQSPPVGCSIDRLLVEPGNFKYNLSYNDLERNNRLLSIVVEFQMAPNIMNTENVHFVFQHSIGLRATGLNP